MKVYLEKWQVKNLRDYFGENDKTQTEHWAFKVFDNALKNKQLTIPVVVGQSEYLVCSCGSRLVKTTSGYHCGNAKCSV